MNASLTECPKSSADDDDPVVVTGIGLATGLGLEREATWTALKAGRSAVRTLPPFDADPERAYIGCPLPDLHHSRPDVDPVHALIARLASDALSDARALAGTPELALRTAVVIGLSKGGVRSLARLQVALRDASVPPEVIAGYWQQSWPGSGASLVSRTHGFGGPCLAPVAACATGLIAVLQGADLIRRGVCDRVLAGSADASLEPLLLGAFQRMRILAKHDGDPSRAVRPWDRRRSGFAVGEGGAVLVLERASRAAARGALPYATIAGGAVGSDAYHATDLNPDPAGLILLIRKALESAATEADAIDHVNVHGTATQANDPLECRALERVLGSGSSRVACTANKAQIGHLLGAAGAVELAITCLAIRDGFVPPTLNLTEPDPECRLDGTPLVGRPRPIETALKLSLGFGGHLAAVVLRRPDGQRRQGVGNGS